MRAGRRLVRQPDPAAVVEREHPHRVARLRARREPGEQRPVLREGLDHAGRARVERLRCGFGCGRVPCVRGRRRLEQRGGEGDCCDQQAHRPHGSLGLLGACSRFPEPGAVREGWYPGLPLSVDFRPDELQRLLDLDRKFAKEGLTFDDVLLVPAESRVLPNDVSTRTRLTRSIELSIPVVSAAMDTVTEARLAIALAREGGIGIVHRNLSIEDQVAEVDKVKRSESGMIVEPVTLPPDALVRDALELMARYKVSGVPITDAGGVLVGILTNRDLRFETDVEQPVSALMTARNLVTAPVGTTLEQAEEILHRNKIEKLPVVDGDGGCAASSPSRTSRRRSSTRRRRRTSAAGCASARRSASGRTPSSARRRSSRQASTCSSSTRRTATRRACSRWCARSRTRCHGRRDRGQHRDRRGRRGADRRRRRRREGRRRARDRSAPPASSPASACRR